MGIRARHLVLKSIILSGCSLYCQKPALAAEDYSAWAHGTDIILNTSASGAGVASPVNHFPVLVRLGSDNFPFSQARGDGRDIRFSKPDGSPLSYEIERWDSAHARAEIWVRVDSVRGDAAAQSLRLLWGNASAPDSSKAASVFRASENFTAVWHLGGSGTAARANAVAGGNPAVPVAYDGDEGRDGIIAGADSLDGAAAGDYLDVGDGYSGFTAGFTYSVWVYPSAVKKWAHVLDLGNGESSDNLIVNRVNMTNDMGFHSWVGGNSATRNVPSQWVLGQWQHIAVTQSGKNLRMYRNGVQILADTIQAISGAVRTASFLGKSNWAADEFFQGKLDQPELSKTARSPDWIKLAYQNQRVPQTFVTVVKPVQCAAMLAVPGDTSVDEGEMLSLSASVECAESFAWSLVSGPSPRILDPEARTLELRAARVSSDTSAVYRLTAAFRDSTRVRDVRVLIREAIPDPEFTLPGLAAWNGKDSLAYRPILSNLAAIRATRDSILHWKWTFSGPEVETASLPDGILLRSAASQGALQIGLCLDNGFEPVCKSAVLGISATAVSLRPSDRVRMRELRTLPRFRGRDAIGRVSPGRKERVSPARANRSGTAAMPVP